MFESAKFKMIFSIELSRFKDFNNPLGGINELKELIDTIHSLNMGVILDESHKAKNVTSDVNKTLCKIKSKMSDIPSVAVFWIPTKPSGT